MQSEESANSQRLTALLQQQAALAAQAVSQAIPPQMFQPQEGALEQVRLQRANLLMLLVLNIPEFEGEASALPDFVERGGTLIAQLAAAPVDATTDRAIKQLLVGRVSTHVRRELGVTADVSWEDLIKRLKDQYGGARKPFQKQAVTLISAARQKGENPAQFALRMEEGARQLKARVYETIQSQEEAYQVMKVLGLLITERLRREMPERVKKALMSATATSRIEEIVDIIRAEDEEYREANEKEERWTKPHSRRQEERNIRRERPRIQPTFTPTTRREERPRRPERTSKGRQWDTSDRRCYECGQKGHIARFCPYIARRGQNVFKPEPMEVNMVDLERRFDTKKKRHFWVQRKTSGATPEATSEGTTSGSESERSGETSESVGKRIPKNRRTFAEVIGVKSGKQ